MKTACILLNNLKINVNFVAQIILLCKIWVIKLIIKNMKTPRVFFYCISNIQTKNIKAQALFPNVNWTFINILKEADDFILLVLRKCFYFPYRNGGEWFRGKE